ncbi:MAG: inositol 2-dehydrogenase [Flavobacteriaceae bacterium]|nr:inositol 2-dehydrogenase [Flavobacteriaceae bacterium]
MKKIKFGIVGIGRIGKIHLNNIVTRIDNADVVAIADPKIDSETIKTFNKLGVKKIFSKCEELVSDKSIDSIIISSPSSLHSEHISLACKKVKNIFCEKPIDLNLIKIKNILKLVKKYNINFMLGFNRRFDPNFLKVKEIVESKKIGNPQIVKITSRDPSPPPLEYIKTSGGLFLDMAIHDFDLARFILNDEVISVYATGKVFGNPEISKLGDIDTAVTTINFKNGTMAVIDNCRKISYGYDQRIEILGSKGVCGSNNKLNNDHYLFNSKGSHYDLPKGFFIDRYQDSYFNEIKSFINSIQNKTKPLITGYDGLISVAIGLAAKKSITEKRVVDINEILNP